jgi:hypothetical protein
LAPLQYENKIPISSLEMRKLVLSTSYRMDCSQGDLEALFRVTEEEEVRFLDALKPAINRIPPPTDGSESSFIQFWDDNIRAVLLAIFPTATPIRDSNHRTSTRLYRPDFGFLIRSVCTFRGEEKQNRFTGTHPRDELFNKLNWSYDPAPYILG